MSTSTLTEEVSKYTSSLLSSIQSKASTTIEQNKIGKNDSMKSQIAKILTTLEPENTSILCHGIARDVQKLISIVEIVKQKKQADGCKLHQYNCLLSVHTKINPYQKQKSKGDAEVVDFSKALEVIGATTDKNDSRKEEEEEVDDEDMIQSSSEEERTWGNRASKEMEEKRRKRKKLEKTGQMEESIALTLEEKEAQNEIRGDKVYDVPVLYVLLSDKDLSSYLDSDWTIQS